jgi:hypothetical protein
MIFPRSANHDDDEEQLQPESDDIKLKLAKKYLPERHLDSLLMLVKILKWAILIGYFSYVYRYTSHQGCNHVVVSASQ